MKVEQLGSFMKQKEMVTYLSPGAPFFKFKLSHAGKNLEWGGVGWVNWELGGSETRNQLQKGRNVGYVYCSYLSYFAFENMRL